MLTTYTNSKEEEVSISDMALPHLLYSIAKNSKYIGCKNGTADIDGCKKKEDENKAMHQEVLNRFKELSE